MEAIRIEALPALEADSGSDEIPDDTLAIYDLGPSGVAFVEPVVFSYAFTPFEENGALPLFLHVGDEGDVNFLEARIADDSTDELVILQADLMHFSKVVVINSTRAIKYIQAPDATH